MGINSSVKCNYNNIFKTNNFLVYTYPSNINDTLDFKYNYWQYQNDLEIENKIMDRRDRIGQTSEGPLVDYSDYEVNYINWMNNIH